LFWKKSKQAIYVDYPESQRRRDYRVAPSTHTPIQLTIGATPVTVHDISTNGVSFHCDEPSRLFNNTDDELAALLYLGDQHHPLPVSLELIAQHHNECRCRLIHYNLQGQKILSQFIVQHQKMEIRAIHESQADQPSDPSNSYDI